MWPTRREMSRDECRKYLRYLELDAYGSMVSVLRAQGPFTNDKQKLLQELARLLHISNERHRAEVRRAVNDEKLTQVAEQLGGPNTGIDWTIEGRRVIPLLPRLKGRSAFTTLANSLSLATAAANDRKPLVQEKIEQSKDIYESQVKVKVEESSSDTDEIVPGEDESSNERICLEQVSTVKQLDIDSESSNHDIVQSIASRKRKSPSPLPAIPPHKVLVITSSLENLNHTEKVVTENIIQPPETANSQPQNVPVIPRKTNSSPNTSGSTETSVDASNHTTVQTSNCISTTAVTSATPSKSKIKPTVHNKLNTKVVTSHLVPENSSSVSQNVQTQAETKVPNASDASQKKSSLDYTNSASTCTKRLESVPISSAKPVPTNVVTSNNSQRVTAISPSTTESSGPGPPQSKQTLACKQLSTLNHQTTAKTDANAAKPVNTSHSKLASKTNVIVIQKGHAKGVTLSHAGKEVVGKVVMGGKSFVTPQSSGSPKQVSMNNGHQSPNSVSSRNSTHSESNTPDTKPSNTIVFNLRHDVPDKQKVLSQLLDSSSVFTSEPKTVIHNTNARSLKEQTNSDLSVIDNEPTNDHTVIDSSDDDQETGSADECKNANSPEVNSLDSIGSLENAEIVIASELREDNDASNIELKRIICTSEEMDEKQLAGTEISLDNVQYLVEDGENYILEETRSPILTISQNVNNA